MKFILLFLVAFIVNGSITERFLVVKKNLLGFMVRVVPAQEMPSISARNLFASFGEWYYSPCRRKVMDDPSDTERSIPVSVKLPESLLKRVDEARRRDERSRSWMIRKALESYLPDPKEEAKPPSRRPPASQRRVGASAEP